MKNRLSDTIVTAKARAEHIALWNELAACIDRHNRKVPGDDVVAVVANLLGHLMVVRDLDKVRSAEMRDLANDNIVFGQRQARAELGNKRTRH